MNCGHCGQVVHVEAEGVLVDETGGDVCGSYGSYRNEPHVVGWYAMFPDECPSFADGGPHQWVEDWEPTRYGEHRVVYCVECGAEPDTQLSTSNEGR